jgi:ribonucleotide monophosphatase NagD (HAD superfamily)
MYWNTLRIEVRIAHHHQRFQRSAGNEDGSLGTHRKIQSDHQQRRLRDQKTTSRNISNTPFERTGAKVEESLMIGDDWDADILGARDFGMHQAWLKSDEGRHNYKATYTLEKLGDLLEIL